MWLIIWLALGNVSNGIVRCEMKLKFIEYMQGKFEYAGFWFERLSLQINSHLFTGILNVHPSKFLFILSKLFHICSFYYWQERQYRMNPAWTSLKKVKLTGKNFIFEILQSRAIERKCISCLWICSCSSPTSFFNKFSPSGIYCSLCLCISLNI